jgi:hypothetical protein
MINYLNNVLSNHSGNKDIEEGKVVTGRSNYSSTSTNNSNNNNNSKDNIK